jgi:hypothetical protein
MSDQYPFRTEIEQILRKNTRSHFAKRFLGMQKGLTDAEMAEEAVRAGERIAYVRETVRLTLEVNWPTARHGPSRRPRCNRELLNYPMTPELRQQVTTRLTQLQQIDPSISLKPLGDIRLGANKRPRSTTPEPPCKKCHLTPCFCD